jgi:UDP-N-acetylglucosamine transferase subunit ALG13
LIFVCTGSRKFQFNRLIQKIDELVADGIITEDVFAQIAETTYIPQHISYRKYLSPEEFKDYQTKASLIITHAGTGALISSLKLGKQVISVPRLYKYNEHLDDHQLQVSGVLASEGYLREVLDIEKLVEVIRECKENPITKKYNKPSNIVSIIERQIDEWFS